MTCDSQAECWEEAHLCSWPSCQSARSSGADQAATMRIALDNITMLRAFQGARRLAKRKRDPNWVFAMEMFGLGSTYAWGMCERMGVDPDSTSAEVAS